MLTTKTAALGAAATVVAANVAAAQPTVLLESFETMPTYEVVDNGGADVIGLTSTGATDGATAVEIVAPGGFNQGARVLIPEADLPFLQDATTLLIDVTVVDPVDTFFQTRLYFSYRDTDNMFPFPENDFTDAIGGGFNEGELGNGETGTITAVWDLTDVDLGNVNPSGVGDGYFFALGITTNGPSTTYYLDNIRVVIPEPTTAGLLALGSLAMLRRHRR